MSQTEEEGEGVFDQPFAEEREHLQADQEGHGDGDAVSNTVPDGDEVDWAAIWDEFGIDEDACVSRTQIAAAIRASEETGCAKEGDADGLVSGALEAGQLSQVKRKAHTEQDTSVLVTAGYRLEVSR